MSIIEQVHEHLQTQGAGRSRRYPAHLREAILKHIERETGRGRRQSEVVRELGVDISTVTFWKSRKAKARFSPVQIKNGPAIESAVVLRVGRLSIEGLQMETVASLLRALGC